MTSATMVQRTTFLSALWAVLLVVAQTTQNVSLPIWNDSLGSNGGPYFILFYATAAYTVLFFGFLGLLAFRGHIKRTDVEYPQLPLIIIGVCDAANGILVVYASSPSRTAPFLQSILGNFTIPMTILFRYLIMKRADTQRQLLCAVAVTTGLFLALVPSIFQLNNGKGPDQSGQSGIARFLWPLCFMLGFVPAAIMNVIEERALKDTVTIFPGEKLKEDDIEDMTVPFLSLAPGSVNGDPRKRETTELNQIWLLAFTSLYQWITIVLTFWTDIIPHFGMAGDIDNFWNNFRNGFLCNFGSNNCDFSALGYSFIFISAYIVSYMSGAALLRNDVNGATWQAIVITLVTPLGALFWSLFQHGPPVKWGPEFEQTTWYSVGGLAIMIPAMLLYHIWGAAEQPEPYFRHRQTSHNSRTSFISTAL